MNKTLKLIMTFAAVLIVCCMGTAAAIDYNVVDAVRMHFAGTTIEESQVTVTEILPLGAFELETVRVAINNGGDEITISVNVFVNDVQGEELWVGTRTLTVPPNQGVIPMQLDSVVSMEDVQGINIVIKEV